MTDWNDVEGWTQVVATIVALVGLAVTWYFTWRGQRVDAARAEQAAVAAQAGAERAERTSALSIDTLERIADALEALAAPPVAPDVDHPGARASDVAGVATPLPGGPGQSRADPSRPPRVRWQLSHLTGDRYMLRNVGAATAHRVVLRTDPTMPVAEFAGVTQTAGVTASGTSVEAALPTVLAPGEHLTFEPRPTPLTRDRTVTVVWAASDGPGTTEERWRYPLPPR